MIQLADRTTAKKLDGIKIYCGCGLKRGRLLASPLGNTEHNNRTHPGSTLPAYRDWLRDKAADRKSPQSKLLRKISILHRRGFTVILTCHCKDTTTCHCNVIKDAVETHVRRTPDNIAPPVTPWWNGSSLA